MSRFIQPFTVNSHDTDLNGNLRPSIALRYIHEAAHKQFEVFPPNFEEMRQKERKAFLLSRVAMEIDCPLHEFEEIEAHTWASGGKAATFYRSGELFRGGERVAKLVSLWALVDIDTRRLLRVKDTVLGMEILEEYPLEIPGHVRFPDGLSWEEVGSRRVMYSDTDLNCHMNNTNYPDMMCDFIPDIEKSFVKGFSIGYLHEAKLGETVSVMHACNGDTHYIRTLLPDGRVNAEGIFTLEVLR